MAASFALKSCQGDPAAPLLVAEPGHSREPGQSLGRLYTSLKCSVGRYKAPDLTVLVWGVGRRRVKLVGGTAGREREREKEGGGTAQRQHSSAIALPATLLSALHSHRSGSTSPPSPTRPRPDLPSHGLAPDQQQRPAAQRSLLCAAATPRGWPACLPACPQRPGPVPAPAASGLPASSERRSVELGPSPEPGQPLHRDCAARGSLAHISNACLAWLPTIVGNVATVSALSTPSLLTPFARALHGMRSCRVACQLRVVQCDA